MDCCNQMGSHRMLHLLSGPGSGQMYDVALPPGNSSRAEETIHRAPGPLGHQRFSSVFVFTGTGSGKETVSPAGLSRWTATCHLSSPTFACKLVAKGSYEGGGESLSLWPLGSVQEKRMTSPIKSQVHSWNVGAKRTQAVKSGPGSRHHHSHHSLRHLKSFHPPSIRRITLII